MLIDKASSGLPADLTAAALLLLLLLLPLLPLLLFISISEGANKQSHRQW
jgi:hypothetical protein